MMKLNIPYLLVCLSSVLILGGCTKEELGDLNTGYKKVRLYDDTLADPRNTSIRIASGTDRLLMTYGTTADQLTAIFGTLVYPSPGKCAWMLTDNDGKLIRRDTLPSGLNIADVTSLPDNSFLILTYTGIPNLFGGPEWWLFLTRVDRNGAMDPTDTLIVPGIAWPCQQIYSSRLSVIPNGNILISFGYGDLTHYGNFIGEMNMQGNFLWYKLDQAFTVNDYVTTPEGGYMALASFWDAVTQTTENVVMKTTSTFDSTWSKPIVMEHEAIGGMHIVSAGNGNYRVGYTDAYGGSFNTHVMEINSVGETIKSNSWQIISKLDPYSLSTRMLQHRSSGMFISYSRSEVAVSNSTPDQFNTIYVTLDATLDVTQQTVIQDQTSDMLNSCCNTSDGRIACFGVVQSHGRRYYKPMLVILD